MFSYDIFGLNILDLGSIQVLLHCLDQEKEPDGSNAEAFVI